MRSHSHVRFIILSICMACACVGIAVWSFVDGASFFSHPIYDGIQPQHEQGARWFGISLCAFSVVLIGSAFFLSRTVPAGVASDGLEERESRSTRLAQWLVLGIVAVGVLVRAMRINESLWYDEINAILSFARYGPGACMGNYFDPVNHIFHSILTWASSTLLSTAPLEISARIPALLFSLGTIPIMFMLGDRVKGSAAGIIAAALSAILPVLVLEGVDARGYSMMMFFTACSTLVLIDAIRRDSPWLWVVYSLMAALGVWTHFATAFVPIGHVVWIVSQLVQKKETPAHLKALVAVLLAGALSVVLYAPALPDFIKLLAQRSTFAALNADQPTLFSAEGFHALLQLGGSWYLAAALPGLVFLCIGMLVSVRNHRSRGMVAMLLLGAAIFAVTVAISGTWVYARFMLFAMPGAIVLIAIGIDALWSRSKFLGGLAGVLIILASASDLAIRPPRQPLREAVQFVVERNAPSRPIIAVGIFHEVISIYQPPNMTLLFTKHSEPSELETMIEKAQPQFVIVYYPNLLSQDRKAFLAATGYQVTLRLDGWQDWGKGDVTIFEKR